MYGMSFSTHIIPHQFKQKITQRTERIASSEIYGRFQLFVNVILGWKILQLKFEKNLFFNKKY
jgi:hypothetical protein